MIEIKNIYKSYKYKESIFKKSEKKVLKGISFDIAEGKCLGLVGESGSGKSTLGKIILGIEKPDKGNIIFDKNIFKDYYKNKISVVFQDYTSSVNPRFKIIDIISEPLNSTLLKQKNKKEKVSALLTEVGLDSTFLYRYPHQLSGGQLQRVCIARAISTKPKFILLDEPVSSLDVSVQLQILELLKKIKMKYKLSFLFITHDLMTVTYLCDKVIFFKNGMIIETIENIKNIKNIKNPYSKSLFNAVKELEIPNFRS